MVFLFEAIYILFCVFVCVGSFVSTFEQPNPTKQRDKMADDGDEFEFEYTKVSADLLFIRFSFP